MFDDVLGISSSFNPRWPVLFNAVIERLDLKELELSVRQYTWANRREVPTYEKLDRILASVEWEKKFPLVTVCALTRMGSDHTRPLLIDSGESAHLGNCSLFSFELSWFRQEGFFEMVKAEWMSISSGATLVD